MSKQDIINNHNKLAADIAMISIGLQRIKMLENQQQRDVELIKYKMRR